MMRGYWGHQGIGSLGGHHMMGGWGIAGMILMIILWLVVIAAIVLIIRALILHSRRHGTAGVTGAVGAYPPAVTAPPAGPASNLLAILEERYAKGDITRDEFLQRKADLGLGEAPTVPSATPPVAPPLG